MIYKVVIELRIVLSWVLTRAAVRLFDFEIMRMISVQIGLHSVNYHY